MASQLNSAPTTAALGARVRKRFPSGFALDLDFAAPPGVTIVFGASGSGKTTLLNTLAGLLRPDAGRIVIGDRVLYDSATDVNVRVSRRNIGYVFQALALFPHLSVGENVGYGLSRLKAGERRARVAAILEAFRIRRLAHRRPAELSGGERQRVALARSMVTEPCAMLLDEPLSALDLPTQSRLIADLHVWNERRHIPILYVTHSQRETYALGERVLVLERGKVLTQGTPQEVLSAPREETIAELAGVENVFDATVTAVHEEQGTMTCRLADTGLELEVPLGHYQPGAPARVAIHAGDILLATDRPAGLSARNVIPGKIGSLSRLGVTVHAEVDCGIIFRVKLTPAGLRALALEVGRPVWLVIKTYSCHLLRSGS